MRVPGGVGGGPNQVLHRVSVSVSCQTSGLSFTRRPPRAALSTRRYALITAQPPRRAASQNSNCIRPAGRRARVCGRKVLNIPTPGGHADSPRAARLESVKSTRWWWAGGWGCQRVSSRPEFGHGIASMAWQLLNTPLNHPDHPAPTVCAHKLAQDGFHEKEKDAFSQKGP